MEPESEEIQEKECSPQLNSLCEVCKQTPWKYTCPGCFVKTCCLKCVTTHKSESGCDGKKKETPAFRQKVPMDKMSMGVLKKDIGFLESGITLANQSKK